MVLMQRPVGIIWHFKESSHVTPVLHYYSQGEKTIIRCDASSLGIVAALFQAGQPVAYCSWAMIPTEIWYAQIEKELLAIAFCSDEF